MSEERRALAAIIAAGVVTYRRPYTEGGYRSTAAEALAVADAIIKQDQADLDASVARGTPT
jgi:hypothetical protein